MYTRVRDRGVRVRVGEDGCGWVRLGEAEVRVVGWVRVSGWLGDMGGLGQRSVNELKLGKVLGMQVLGKILGFRNGRAKRIK